MEFAIVLPLLLLLLFGIIDFGRAFYTSVTLTHAAREGVRIRALDSGDWQATTLNAAAPLAPVSASATACDPGDPTSVTATYSFNFVTPIGAIAALAGGSLDDSGFTISRTGVMRCGG